MKPAQTRKITIDTNCVAGLFDAESQTATSTDELRDLVRYALGGAIELCTTTRVDVDLRRDKDIQRRAIGDDTRGAARDELTFEFVILPGGATDFSK